MGNKIEFALILSPSKGWIDLAKMADNLGYTEIRLQSDMAYYDSFSAYAYGVTQTRNLRFYPYANSVFLRHPVLMASGIANINEIAPGRIGAA